MKRKTLAAAMALGLSLTLAAVELHAQNDPGDSQQNQPTQASDSRLARDSRLLVGQPVLGHDGQTKGVITQVNANQSVVIRKADGKEMTVPYDKLKFVDLDNGEIKIMMAKDIHKKTSDSARRPAEPPR